MLYLVDLSESYESLSLASYNSGEEGGERILGQWVDMLQNLNFFLHPLLLWV
jgi:hypothetical protein